MADETGIPVSIDVTPRGARIIAQQSADAAYDAAIAYATQLGAEHGAGAAGWYVQETIGGRSGNSAVDDRATATRILAGIEDGDPEVLDTLPRADLSGEWAATLTGPMLVHDAVEAAYAVADGHYPHVADWFTDVCDAYESAYADAAESAIAASARAILA